MPPNNHAVLSASSSHIWLHCTPSARLELEFDSKTSEAAAEGSAAHALAEHKLKRALKMRSQRPTSPYEDDAMDEYTTDYVSFVMEQFFEMKDGDEDPLVLIEQRLDFSSYVPDGFGTGDAVLVSPGKLHVIDFKYGQGVLVEAERNSQMMLYGLAALKKYSHKYKIKRVSMSIFQPRRENVSTWTITATELRKWAKTELVPRARVAYNGEGEYLPGDHCQFCRAAVKCRARAEEKLRLAQKEFSLPPLLSDDEVEEILTKLPDITKWANDLMAYATDAALFHGKEWNGYKVVEGRSVRKYSDEEAVAKAAHQAGYQEAPPAAFYPVTASPFIDVAEGAYYYDAVLWAVDKGVTKGTSATTFSPDLTCTRAQAVTLLWRAMGSPEPVSKTCPFTDVKPDSDYYKAILWATEKGITEGTSATTFSPDLTVTRAQTVTLLWRAAGKPAQTATQPFTDVKSGAYYESAVLWAVARGITEGTSATTFTPANGCTRAQIVTFLYRYLGK